MNVLRFIETGDEGDEPTVLAGKMAKEYQRIKLNKEWMVSYMTLYEREQERLEIARQESYEKGIEKGIEKGMERGLERGLEKGREEARMNLLEIARAMLKAGQGIDSLRTVMKLSEEEVEYVLKA